MTRKNVTFMLSAFILVLVISGPLFPQKEYPLPKTILPESLLKILLDEISGQLAFNNEVMMAGHNHIRTEEEYKTFFYEGEYLTKKLKEYGVDEVRLEDVAEKPDPDGREWWAGLDAELRMIEPENKRLSRLVEHPALMARGCDPGEWEGEVVYLDRQDLPKLKDMDLKGKILLTPEYPGYLTEAFTNGAIGVISYNNGGKGQSDPFQVMFGMKFNKRDVQQKLFCFHIWPHLGEQLKEIIFSEQKLVLRAMAKTAAYPFKMDTIFACIKGKEPQKKGLMFTAHLYERPTKQGANDNVSGCVVLAEIARTITTLIKEGKIERPERSIYFLMSEEGSGTMAFFKKYPDMANKILVAINMDMVGEDLEKNQAFFYIEKPLYSSTSFLEALTGHFADFVFITNTERPEHNHYEMKTDFPLPIVEKNGSRQPFRYIRSPFMGSSDHMTFIESDSGIPALMFSTWPDRNFHTDKDRPGNSDPTQLKRIAFIGAASALAVCNGEENILAKLIRVSYQDRLAFRQDTLARAIRELSLVEENDNGATYDRALNYITQSMILSKNNLSYLKDLTLDKKSLDRYLNNLLNSFDDFAAQDTKSLENYYRNIAQLKRFKPELPKPSAEDTKLKHTIPVRLESIPLGGRLPIRDIFRSFRKAPEFSMKIFNRFAPHYLMELYLCINGKRNMAEIRDLMNIEFEPLTAADFLKITDLWVEAGLIKIKK